jgi:renalase
MFEQLHFAVVGAGLAGLSCATALQQGGCAVTVFDKSRGPAGRMSTRRGDGWQCDHGAQYFTARDPAFRAEVARWQRAGAAALWTPRLQVLGGAMAPLSDAAARQGAPERFVGTPRMTAPATLLASGLRLHCGMAVDAIVRRDARWHLSVAGELLAGDGYDGVLLAVPAPQAAPLLVSVAPDLAALDAAAEMLPGWALMLRYDTPQQMPFDAAFVNQGPLRWIARDSSKPGRHGAESWLLHASAAWSALHLERDEEAVAALLLAEFALLGGAAPAAWSAHRWRYASTLAAHHGGCVWRADAALGLCGDWLNGGKVEGAWLSGRALAGLALAAWRPVEPGQAR